MAKDRTWIGKLADHLAGRVKDVPKEVYGHLTDRFLPQGAGELGHVLYTGSAYLPYGPGQRPVEPDKAKEGDETQPPSAEQQRGAQTRSNDRGLEM